ncbi:MAG: hypothetical protein Q7T82_01005 [Armatimonadota bacterium]|nr:hypothetical protein [Armatimonadota bacterium]
MSASRVLRIRQVTDLPHQTIGFELTDLPGDEFLLVVPELVSDAEEALLPWSHPSPRWEIGQDSAHCMIDIDRAILMEADVVFRGEDISIAVTVTNLSERIWRLANLFTCFAFYRAPRFNDPDLRRTFIPIGARRWKSVGELFAERDPGPDRHTFFPVRGGPPLEEMWVCRAIDQNHPQVASQGAMCVVSSDGEWVAGMTSPKPVYLFNNRRLHCIHADPLLGTVRPGQVAQGVSTLHIFRGTLEDYEKRLIDSACLHG